MAVQIVKQGDVPVAAVLSWPEYQQLVKKAAGARLQTEAGIPQNVIEEVFLRESSPVKAWRKHLKLTQAEAAARIGISQAAFSQIEKVRNNQEDTLRRVANAFGIDFELLDMI